MKKGLICFVVLLSLCLSSGPAAAAAKTKKMTAQQNRMKACAVQYHEKKIPKHDYRKFMSQCLRKNPKAPTAASAKAKTVTLSAPAAPPPAASPIAADAVGTKVYTTAPASSVPMIQVPVIVSPGSAVQSAPLPPVPGN